MEQKHNDNMAWLWWGSYGLSAVSVAVEHCLAGRRAKSKYVENPVLKEIQENNEPLSEDELQRQRELFVARLEVMKTNFELSH